MVETATEMPTIVAGDLALVDTAMAGAVAVLTLQSPPYNLLGRELTAEIVHAIGWAVDQRARAIVVQSAMRHFSAGAELDQMVASVEGSDVLDWDLTGLLSAFRDCPVPIVASVHGVCVGGGFELALASDLIVVAASAKIGCVEVTVGLHPLMGAVQRLVQRAGAARAAEMAMLGRRYDAATLERWGVVNRVVPDDDLQSATMVIAQELAHGPTLCHTATKKLIAVAVAEGVQAADRAMAEIQRPIFTSQDFRTGVRSFKENGVGMAQFEGR
jgi:enoyl-CoA hydratase/carnithine racemase